MKSQKINLFAIFAAILFAFLACSKSETVTIPATPFKWTYKSGNYTASQYSAFLYSRGTFLIVGAQGNTIMSFPQCNFSLTSFNKGTYSVTAGVNIIRYVDNTGDELQASTGEVTITAYANDVISGYFSAMIQGPSGTSNPISGSFTNIPVVP